MRLPDLLDGPLPPLPALLDRVSERWWSLGPRVRVAVVLASAVLLPLFVTSAEGGAPPTAEVLVAVRDLPPGTRIGPADVAVRHREDTDLPPAATTSLPPDVQTAMLVPTGSVITSHHLSDHGIAGSIPSGRVAVAVASDRLPTSLRPGQRLDLLAGGPDGSGQVIASEARVLANHGDHIWIEMSREEAAQVAGATAWGAIGVGLLPPG